MGIVPSLTLAQAWAFPWHEAAAMFDAANRRAEAADEPARDEVRVDENDPRSKYHTPAMVAWVARMEGRR